MYEPIWKAVVPHLSVARMKADINEFFELSRWSSYDKILSLARLIAAKMEAAGLPDVRLIEAPADGRTAFGGWVMPRAYDVESARLTLLDDSGEPEVLADYLANPTCLMMYSLPTPAGGITVELAVADGREVCQENTVAGKLVLTSRSGVEFSQAAMRAGAVGIICDGTFGRRFFKDGEFLNHTNEWHNYTIPPWDDPSKGFGFSISSEQGRYLREKIATQETVCLHAEVKTRHYDGVLPVVSGRLPGVQAEEIVLTGHYDEFGADDNCSQVAVGLEVMRAIRAMIEAGEIPPLIRGIRLLFPMEVRGFNALVHDQDEIKHIRLGLNIDTVGTDQNAVTSVCTLCDNFAALPSFAEEFLAELLERVSESNPLFRWKRAGADTIDNIFGEPLIGAPTPCIYHYSATHHIPLDTPDRISGRMLQDMAQVTATYAAFLANAGLQEALWMGEVIADHAVQRMNTIATSSLHSGDDKHFHSLLQQVSAVQESYRRRLDTARLLVPQLNIMPTPGNLESAQDSFVGEMRLLPREVYDAHSDMLKQHINRDYVEAKAQINSRAQLFSGVYLADDNTVHEIESHCVPVKDFRGFLAFEDLCYEERNYINRELGIELGWGAPFWLQESLMLANGKRTVEEIVALLHRHGYRIPDVQRVSKIFEFLQQRGLVRFRPYLTQSEIRGALDQLGLTVGDAVLGHFALSRFGYIEGGAEGLIDTILQLLGPDGTLMMPTFTFSWVGHQPYEPARTPSRVGTVTNHFWRRAGVQRSLHPTHSFAATGKLASLLLEGHDHTQPPLDHNSPIARLAPKDGKILLFSPKSTNTAMHVGEYAAGIPFVDFMCPFMEDGIRREVVVPGCPWHVAFDAAYKKLCTRGQITEVSLGESAIYSMRCRDAIEAQAEVARETPEVLIQSGCHCAYCEGLKHYCAEH